MKPFIFHVEAAGELRRVELTFASEREVRHVRTWRKKTPGSEVGEFAALAAKRWFYYTREGAAVDSLDGLRAAIRQNERAELAFLVVASAEWVKHSKTLALAYCRRTWCHHLILDFLAVRPGVEFANQAVYGIGTGILYCLTNLADKLKMDTIWGEATASSAPFYEKVLQIRPIKDLFIINRETMRRIQLDYLTKQKGRLRKR